MSVIGAFLLALAPAAIDADPELIRRQADRDIAKAIAEVETLLATPAADPCARERLELVLVAGEVFLAAARDGQIKDPVLSQLDACESAVTEPAMLARAEKLRAYAEPNKPKGLKHAAAAVEAARRQRDRKILAESLQVEAFLLRVLGMLGEADRSLQEGIRIAVDLGDAVLKARLYSDYANLRKQSGDLDSALEYINKALALAEANGANRIAVSIRLHRALINLARQDYEAAEREQRKLLEETTASGNISYQAILLNNIASQYLRQERYAEVPAAAEKALKLAREIPSMSLEMRSLANLGVARMKLGMVEQGVENMQAALELGRELGIPEVQAGLLQELSRVKYRQNDFRGAYDDLSEAAAIQESLSRTIRESLLSESQARFDVLVKQSEIRDLESELAWNSERLEQQRYINILAASTALLFVALVVFIAARYLQVRKLNGELNLHARKLEEFSKKDALTGLFNRRYFEQQLKLAADRPAAPAGEPHSLSLFLIDIDHFKQLNDTEGHGAGDEALIQFAERLKASLRENELIARWGGEEFCILADVRTADDLRQLAERLRTAICTKAFLIGGMARAMSCSIGAVMAPLGESFSDSGLLRYVAAADAAMYTAKRMGRNRVVCFEVSRALDESVMQAIGQDPEAACAQGLLRIHA